MSSPAPGRRGKQRPGARIGLRGGRRLARRRCRRGRSGLVLVAQGHSVTDDAAVLYLRVRYHLDGDVRLRAGWCRLVVGVPVALGCALVHLVPDGEDHSATALLQHVGEGLAARGTACHQDHRHESSRGDLTQSLLHDLTFHIEG